MVIVEETYLFVQIMPDKVPSNRSSQEGAVVVPRDHLEGQQNRAESERIIDITGY